MWAENTKPKLFGHLLAQQVASNHSIDPADGVEPVPQKEKCASLEKFDRRVTNDAAFNESVNAL